MARFTIPRLVGKTNAGGLTSWYWQPSATLRAKGWQPQRLGSGIGPDAPEDVAAAARALNREVDGAGLLRPAELRRIQRPLTVDELARRYEAAGFPSVKKTRQGKPVAPATQRQYRSKLRTVTAWGKGVALSSVTAERVGKLRDALMVPVPNANSAPGSGDGPGEMHVRHYAAHETLRVARTLFTWAEQQHLIAKGTNPFADFGLAAPEPRDQIWWAPTREILLELAEAQDPSLALAIDLAFSIGQREADMLKLSITQYAEIPHFKIDPDVYAQLAEPDAAGRLTVMGVRLRQNKGKRWIEVPVVGDTRRRIEAQIADARAAGVTALLFDRSSGRPWTLPNVEAGQRRFIRAFAELRTGAIAAAAERREPELAAELEALQFRDFRRTSVVYLGELNVAVPLIAAVTGHDLDTTQDILDVYMPRTTGMAARAIALSQARSPQSGTSGRGEKEVAQ